MSSRTPPPIATLKRRRKRLLNRLGPLRQLDLFTAPDPRTLREIEHLKAAIAALTSELIRRETPAPVSALNVVRE
jgi:hypothetical protein